MIISMPSPADIWSRIGPFIYLTMHMHAGPDGHRLHCDDDPGRDLWQRCCYGLWHCLDGTLVLERGPERWECRSGRVGFCEPGMTVVLAPGTRCHRVVFDLLYRERVKGDRCYGMIERMPQVSWGDIFGLPLPVTGTVEEDRHAAAMIDGICNRDVYGDLPSRLRSQAQLYAWLVDRVATAAGTPAEADRSFAEQVERLLALHLRQGPDIGVLARRLGVSRQTLLRRYRAQRGHPPREALRRIRLACACDQLAREGRRDRVLARSTELCGFASVNSFGRWFRTQTGLSPTAWRRRRLAAAES